MIISRTLAIVKLIFKRHPDPNRPDRHIIRLLDITLNNNDFTFNNKIYLQVHGIAMGKAYAPSLGNIYLLDFDKYLMQGLDGCIPSLPYRFLDDVFFIWLGDIQSLQRLAYILIL